MNFEEIIWRLKNEPEWAVLGLLIASILGGGGVYFYLQSGSVNQEARQQFSGVLTRYSQAQQTGDFERVTKQFQQLYKRHDKKNVSDKILFFWAKSLFESGKHLDAQKQFQRLVDQHPNSFFNESALLHLGYASMEREKYQQATTYFERVLKQSSDNSLQSEVLWQLALSQYRQKQTDKAVATLDRLIEESSNSEDSYWLHQARDLKSAIQS